MALRECEALWSGFSLDLKRVVIWVVPATRQPFGLENTTKLGANTEVCKSIQMHSYGCYDSFALRGPAWVAEAAASLPSEKRINKS